MEQINLYRTSLVTQIALRYTVNPSTIFVGLIDALFRIPELSYDEIDRQLRAFLLTEAGFRGQTFSKTDAQELSGRALALLGQIDRLAK